MSDQKFRVLIIGAGPNGLYIAHALSAANIDYVVLEKQPSIIRHQGAPIILWPHSARLLDQLGLFEDVKKRSYTMHSKAELLVDGRLMVSYPMWKKLEEHHAYPMLPLPRSNLLEALYERLPDKETKVRTGAELVDIEIHEAGIRARLADGSVESGSIVIGADGVHSKTRELMQKMSKPAGTEGTGNTMIATYYGIYGKAPNRFGVKSGFFYETRGTGMGSQVVTTPNMLHFILYKRLTEPTSRRTRYSREQMEEFATSFHNVCLAPGLNFKDVWEVADKESARLVNQEEGYVENWSHGGRIVLIGDSAVKTTSMSGLNVNVGMHSAALLASELQKLVIDDQAEQSASPRGQTPDTASLDQAFARYQRFRQNEARRIYKFGYAVVRQVTWSSWSDWFIDRIIMPWYNRDHAMRTQTYPMVSNGQVLAYVPFEGKQGPVPWRRVPDVKI